MKKLALALSLFAAATPFSFAAQTNCQWVAEKAAVAAAESYPDETVFLVSREWQDQLTEVCVLTKVYSLQRVPWEVTRLSSVQLARDLKDDGMPGAALSSLVTVRAAYEQVKDSIKGGGR